MNSCVKRLGFGLGGPLPALTATLSFCGFISDKEGCLVCDYGVAKQKC